MHRESSQLVIVGGGGFLGKILVNYAKNYFSNILVISRSYQWDTTDLRNERSITLVKENARLTQNYKDLILCNATVVYMAGSTNLSLSEKTPIEDFENHVLSLTSFLKLLKQKTIYKAIFISSGGAVYGEPLCHSSREVDQCFPKSIYGMRNKVCEDIARTACDKYGIKNLILRVANPYGIDQLYVSRKGLIMSLINSCFDGSRINLRANGLQCRDYIYGTDLCALITALAKRNNHYSPPVINICSGKSFNALEICDLIYANLGMQPAVNCISGHDDFEINNSRLDNTVLTSLLSELKMNQLFKPLDNTLPIFLQTESVKTGQVFNPFM